MALGAASEADDHGRATSGVSTDEKHGLMAVVMRALEERRITSIFVEHDIDIVRRYATAWRRGSRTDRGQRCAGRSAA